MREVLMVLIVWQHCLQYAMLIIRNQRYTSQNYEYYSNPEENVEKAVEFVSFYVLVVVVDYLNLLCFLLSKLFFLALFRKFMHQVQDVQVLLVVHIRFSQEHLRLLTIKQEVVNLLLQFRVIVIHANRHLACMASNSSLLSNVFTLHLGFFNLL